MSECQSLSIQLAFYFHDKTNYLYVRFFALFLVFQQVLNALSKKKHSSSVTKASLEPVSLLLQDLIAYMSEICIIILKANKRESLKNKRTALRATAAGGAAFIAAVSQQSKHRTDDVDEEFKFKDTKENAFCWNKL